MHKETVGCLVFICRRCLLQRPCKTVVPPSENCLNQINAGRAMHELLCNIKRQLSAGLWCDHPPEGEVQLIFRRIDTRRQDGAYGNGGFVKELIAWQFFSLHFHSVWDLYKKWRQWILSRIKGRLYETARCVRIERERHRWHIIVALFIIGLFK